jgi:hypothetical protein
VGSARLALRILASERLEPRVVHGATAPPQGWVSRRYGEKRAAPVIESRFRARPPAACLTLLEPRRAGIPARVASGARMVPVRCAGDGRPAAVALALAHDRGEDLVLLAAGDAVVDAGPCRVRAGVLWARFEAGRPARWLALDATRVELGGELLLESALPVNRFWSASSARRRVAVTTDRVEEPIHVRHRRDR